MTKKFHPLLIFFREFSWIHIGLGLTGNLSFFVGSIFFLWKSMQTIGVWLFIIGSFGMLIGSFGSLMVALEKYAQKRHAGSSVNR